MNAKAKIEQLQAIINDSLSPLIDRDYYLLEIPYYTNIGDTLIWQGEMDFLSRFPYRCKGMYSLETFPYHEIENGSLVLFQGGGNFGDLWTKHHDFKMDIIRRYPDNKFIFFPQTVFFQKEENLKSCAKFLAGYDNITICARDMKSFGILRDNFNNEILMVPDMAFFMDMKRWMSPVSEGPDLLLKRTDAEFRNTEFINQLSVRSDIAVTDWPTMMFYDRETRILFRLRDSQKWPKCFCDNYAYHAYRKHLIRTGVKLLACHSVVYSTRLHACILGLLMDKSVVLMDNSYGKNKSFYDTWLSDSENVSFADYE